jgi:hypothetical protein
MQVRAMSDTYKATERAKARMAEVFTMVETLYLTHDELTRRLLAIDISKLPKHAHEYLRGYCDARREAHQRMITWVKWLDGRLVTSDAINILTQLEAKKKQPATYRSPWQRVNGDLSRHVWIGRDGQPLLSKPYVCRKPRN